MFQGLCGTFNENQKDDFLTPEGDTEQSAISFANKWKTHEACSNIPNRIPSHPCDVNMHRKTEAEKVCSVIKSELFTGISKNIDLHFSLQDINLLTEEIINNIISTVLKLLNFTDSNYEIF